ncbi:Putative Fe-S cluster [Alkalispirochaeta americana]|uniref:histidine kinase n=1 Tax=Alkalispirochaeta americana TaxID=159291 RepID=A0A1N6Q773_9SPIO|nr:[Fe-Fe] hydrogenase large subunit C-terminal domain-containing protein [Alkalispirochaeta americana]SIQ12397.1 Putative Fe-S cluster [Alkalispirochaeta americana]
MESLSPVIATDDTRCVNCHRCISVCPVKYCINGSADAVAVNHEACIGCGSCIAVCRHGARTPLDQAGAFFADLRARIPLVVLVAPSVASVFPGNYLRLNGFLRSLGAAAVFDVSFGAELTARSYVDYLEREQPKTLLAQPCPAIVSYIELLRPELLPYLAPLESPMGHTARMIRRFYPDYADHRIAALSPCLAKKREFEETGLIDYNVTFASLATYLENTGISLADYNREPYTSPPAERGVLFSSPGGLLRTVAREKPGVAEGVRKIEGPDQVYPYLNQLEEVLAAGDNPLLVDCLNCSLGCNGGPGTTSGNRSIDLLEAPLEARLREHTGGTPADPAAIRQLVDQYWEPGLYHRTYQDRSEYALLSEPSPEEMEEILREMHKYGPEDIYHCSSCGYNDCYAMAKAIFNGINRPQNCHFFQKKEINRLHDDQKRTMEEMIEQQKEYVRQRTRSIQSLLDFSGQGFLSFGSDLRVRPEYSRECHEIFGKEIEGENLAALLYDNSRDREDLADALALIFNGASTADVVFGLLDKELVIREKQIEIDYRAIDHTVIMCSLVDVTEQRMLEEQITRVNQLREMLLAVVINRDQFAALVREADRLFELLNALVARGLDQAPHHALEGALREVHTFKANAAYLKLRKTEAAAHALEDALNDFMILADAPSVQEGLEELSGQYRQELFMVKENLGAEWIAPDETLVIPRLQLLELEHQLQEGELHPGVLADHLRKLQMVPFAPLVDRLRRLAQDLASGRGKRLADLQFQGDNFLLDRENYEALSHAATHLLRNMVDHGIERPHQRERAGKPAQGQITLGCTVEKGAVSLSFEDDGAGFDIEAIGKIAREKGLIQADAQLDTTNLLKLVFSSGFSTAGQVSAVSGRGVGLAAVKEEVKGLGGRLFLKTRLGKGSRFTIVIPLQKGVQEAS